MKWQSITNSKKTSSKRYVEKIGGEICPQTGMIITWRNSTFYSGLLWNLFSFVVVAIFALLCGKKCSQKLYLWKNMTNIRYGREGSRRERGRNRFAHRNFPAGKNSLKQVILFMLFKRRNRLKTQVGIMHISDALADVSRHYQIYVMDCTRPYST